MKEPTSKQTPPSKKQAPSKEPAPKKAGGVDIERILDVEVPVVVRFGTLEMSLGEVARLAPGSVVALDRTPDEPVELLVNDRPFATGEIVVVDGNYALRVRAIVSTADRIRSLGA